MIDESWRGKCVNVEVTVGTGSKDIERAAQSVARECRRLHFEGYDLKGATVKAWLLRDDEPIQPEHELRLSGGEDPRLLDMRPGR